MSENDLYSSLNIFREATVFVMQIAKNYFTITMHKHAFGLRSRSEMMLAAQVGVKPARPFIRAIQSLVLLVPYSDHDCFKYPAAERATPGSVADAE